MLILALLLAVTPVAEEPELLVTGELEHGGFGGPELRYSGVLGQPALFVGGRGGWIIEHRLVIGGAGYGMATSVDAPWSVAPDHNLEFGYGGPFLEVILAPARVAHLSLMTLFAAGGLSYNQRNTPLDGTHQTSAVFVFEPSATIEVNVARYMRLDVGASYRLVTGTDLNGVTNEDVRGLSGVVTAKFGKF